MSSGRRSETPCYRLGLPEAKLGEAAALYEEAFGPKFGVAIPERDARIAIIRGSLVPDRAICALRGSRLIGIAGFHHDGLSLTGGMTMRRLRRRLGLLRALKAALLLGLMERAPRPGELLMDGIAVAPDHRGQGTGAGLLEALRDFARRNGYERIRLDVIDTNLRAGGLYRRMGFLPGKRRAYGYLKPVLGFGGSTEMVLPLPRRRGADGSG